MVLMSKYFAGDMHFYDNHFDGIAFSNLEGLLYRIKIK